MFLFRSKSKNRSNSCSDQESAPSWFKNGSRGSPSPSPDQQRRGPSPVRSTPSPIMRHSSLGGPQGERTPLKSSLKSPLPYNQQQQLLQQLKQRQMERQLSGYGSDSSVIYRQTPQSRHSALISPLHHHQQQQQQQQQQRQFDPRSDLMTQSDGFEGPGGRGRTSSTSSMSGASSGGGSLPRRSRSNRHRPPHASTGSLVGGDRSTGQLFLVFGGETKRAPLPTCITSMEAVWGLFVKAFQDRLTLELFQTPPQQRGFSAVYILDQTAAVFYLLEDLRDVRDMCVLKLFENVTNPTTTEPRPPSSLSQSQPSWAGMGGATSLHSSQIIPQDIYNWSPYAMGEGGWWMGGRNQWLQGRPLSHIAFNSYNGHDLSSSQPYLGPNFRRFGDPMSPHPPQDMCPSPGGSVQSFDYDTRQKVAEMEERLATLQAWVEQSTARTVAEGVQDPQEPPEGPGELQPPTSPGPNRPASAPVNSENTTRSRLLSGSGGQVKVRLDDLHKQTSQLRADWIQIRHMQMNERHELEKTLNLINQKIRSLLSESTQINGSDDKTPSANLSNPQPAYNQEPLSATITKSPVLYLADQVKSDPNSATSRLFGMTTIRGDPLTSRGFERKGATALTSHTLLNNYNPVHRATLASLQHDRARTVRKSSWSESEVDVKTDIQHSMGEGASRGGLGGVRGRRPPPVPPPRRFSLYTSPADQTVWIRQIDNPECLTQLNVANHPVQPAVQPADRSDPEVDKISSARLDKKIDKPPSDSLDKRLDKLLDKKEALDSVIDKKIDKTSDKKEGLVVDKQVHSKISNVDKGIVDNSAVSTVIGNNVVSMQAAVKTNPAGSNATNSVTETSKSNNAVNNQPITVTGSNSTTDAKNSQPVNVAIITSNADSKNNQPISSTGSNNSNNSNQSQTSNSLPSANQKSASIVTYSISYERTQQSFRIGSAESSSKTKQLPPDVGTKVASKLTDTSQNEEKTSAKIENQKKDGVKEDTNKPDVIPTAISSSTSQKSSSSSSSSEASQPSSSSASSKDIKTQENTPRGKGSVSFAPHPVNIPAHGVEIPIQTSTSDDASSKMIKQRRDSYGKTTEAASGQSEPIYSILQPSLCQTYTTNTLSQANNAKINKTNQDLSSCSNKTQDTSKTGKPTTGILRQDNPHDGNYCDKELPKTKIAAKLRNVEIPTGTEIAIDSDESCSSIDSQQGRKTPTVQRIHTAIE